MLTDKTSLDPDTLRATLAIIPDITPDCLKILDASGALLWMNDGGLRLMEVCDPAPLIGASWVDFWPGPGRRQAQAALEAARGGAIGRFRGECATRLGRPKWWDVVVTSMPDDGHALGKFLAVSRDITELMSVSRERDALLERERFVRMEAEKTARARERALLLVSHELRAPLNAIRGWTSMLAYGSSADEIVKGIDAIGENADTLSVLVEQLVDAAQYQRDSVVVPVPNPIATLVSAAVAAVAPAARAKRIAIRSNVRVGGWVMADFQAAQQALSNLLFNAVKFTGAGGAIEVRCSSLRDRVRIAVIDTGIGIDSALLPQLFQPFTQGPSPERRAGLGLGLSIARTIAEAHGGSVEASSAGPGRGSTFALILPKASDPLVV